MIDEKIKHPFQVPENFHSDFKSEMLDLYEIQNDSSKQIRLKKYALNTLKYAAIIAIAFIAGRLSLDLNNTETELADVETIYGQVSEDDIIDFVLDDELLNDL